MEFFTNDKEVLYQDADGLHVLTQGSPVVDDMDGHINELYPDASEALDDIFAKSFLNTFLFRFKRVRRFCKCNFGSLDHTKKDVDNDVFNFERVSCPLRGECPYEGIICMPKMNSRLSEGEKRVMRLLCDGMSNQEIADELCLSPNTVKRHISTAYAKTHTKNRTDFTKYANDNNIFQ